MNDGAYIMVYINPRLYEPQSELVDDLDLLSSIIITGLSLSNICTVCTLSPLTVNTACKQLWCFLL